MSAGFLTDVPGFRVGHWTDLDAGTGCTAIVPPAGVVGACDVRGGGASTRELALLDPAGGPREVAAVIFSGGSAFGLAAADGAMRWCEEQGLGIDTAGARVPIVPAAVIYDLGVTGNTRRPGPDEGYAACAAATVGPHETGSVGAGTGATVGKWNGRRGWCKGGIGAASARLPDGSRVGVLAVVNAFGDVLDEHGAVLAGVHEPGIGFLCASRQALQRAPEHPRLAGAGDNTTLVCVATDAPVGAAGAVRVARMAQAGIGRAINPFNTPLDGDAVFCLAPAAAARDAFVVGVVAADLAATAAREAVRTAQPVRGVPSRGQLVGD